MTKRNNYSIADFILSQMENEGFEVSEFSGSPGHEVVNFKNKRGETRTIEFGFSKAERPIKNYRVFIERLANGEIRLHHDKPKKK